MAQTKTMTATESLVRAALELHRLALTASEIRHLPSPLTPREKNAKGAADPTAGTALDDRRAAVATALDAVTHDAELLLGVELAAMRKLLTESLDRWDSK